MPVAPGPRARDKPVTDEPVAVPVVTADAPDENEPWRLMKVASAVGAPLPTTLPPLAGTTIEAEEGIDDSRRPCAGAGIVDLGVTSDDASGCLGVEGVAGVSFTVGPA